MESAVAIFVETKVGIIELKAEADNRKVGRAISTRHPIPIMSRPKVGGVRDLCCLAIPDCLRACLSWWKSNTPRKIVNIW